MTYQKIAGTLNPGGHPGSYNWQDAYNDLLVIQNDRNIVNIENHVSYKCDSESSGNIGCDGLQRPADSNYIGVGG